LENRPAAAARFSFFAVTSLRVDPLHPARRA
jgi:hypothetical protein